MRRQRRWWPVLALLTSSRPAAAQMQFEIPAEMLQGMMGGGMMGGGGGRGRKQTEWPKSENSEIAPEFEWIVNTEWKGKTAKYMFLRDGLIESPLAECEPEGSCKWAANNKRVLINTPTLKVIRFQVQGLSAADQKKLENKDGKELEKLKLVSEKSGKGGKKSQLDFSRVAVADESEIVSADLYKLLEVPEDVEQSQVKSKFRRLSVQHHPDKGGDPKVFNDMREAYEVLGDQDKRRYYDLGGMQLVKNIEMSWKEVEGQKAQLDAQLTQVPKNHPQYRQFEAQIEAKKRQFDPAKLKPEIEKKMRSDDVEVPVPVSVKDLYNGVASMDFHHSRLVICRGCRANPDSEECKDCGRCPPEKVQVPKYGNTPFGKQVIGMKEKEQESREKCRSVQVVVKDVRVPKGAKEGAILKYPDIGDQTPGKLPGKVILKVQRGSPNDVYTISEADLYTVMHISMEQAMFGFEMSFEHLGTEKIDVAHKISAPDEVLRFKKQGLVGEGGQRGDLYVRLAIDLPKVKAGETSLTLHKPSDRNVQPQFEREVPIELREGSAWQQWTSREAARTIGSKKGSKDEL